MVKNNNNPRDNTFDLQQNLTSLNSPVACFTSYILNVFTMEDQVFNYI